MLGQIKLVTINFIGLDALHTGDENVTSTAHGKQYWSSSKKLKIEPGVVVYTCILTFERLRQEDHEFEAMLKYIVSSRLAWVI
jgi:hypothetical protein